MSSHWSAETGVSLMTVLQLNPKCGQQQTQIWEGWGVVVCLRLDSVILHVKNNWDGSTTFYAQNYPRWQHYCSVHLFPVKLLHDVMSGRLVTLAMLFHWSFVWKTLPDGRLKAHDCKIRKSADFGQIFGRNPQISKIHKIHRFLAENLQILAENPWISNGFLSQNIHISKNPWNLWILAKNPQISWILVNSGLKLAKLTISFHSRVKIQGGNIFFQPKSMDFSKIHIFPFKSVDLKLNPLI